MLLKHRTATRDTLYKSTWRPAISATGRHRGLSRLVASKDANSSGSRVGLSETGRPMTLQEHVASPMTMATSMTGFALVAAGVFVPANRQGQELYNSVVQMLPPADMGAAQAAPLSQAAASQAAASAADPAANTISAAADTSGSLPSSPLLDLDQAVHTYVTTHTSLGFRAVTADIYISDVFITAGIFGWLLCSAMCLQISPKKSVGPLTLAWFFYFATCGAVTRGDPGLVDLLKHLFARIRPSQIHHTFSFPSGHTSAAVFVVGALLTVLLPLTIQLATEQQSRNSSSSSGHQDSVAQEDTAPDSCRDDEQLVSIKAKTADRFVSGDSGWSWDSYSTAAVPVWAAAWVTTGTGRVLADAHWVTDTLAGGCLAVAAVSALTWCCRFLEQGTMNQDRPESEPSVNRTLD